jgi:hypothetical protein
MMLKRSSDPDYRQNQTDAQKDWLERNPDYWRRYRENNPDYVDRNRASQKRRNANRRLNQQDNTEPVAKIDASNGKSVLKKKVITIPLDGDEIARIDAIRIQIEIVSKGT